MEDKAVILSVLIMSLIMAQIQVEAKSCCPTTSARNIYNSCRLLGTSQKICASLSGCLLINGTECPECCRKLVLENSDEDVNEYCKLGCTSSVCGALITLENSDASEIVNEAFEECTNACSTLCAKGFKTALDQIA